MTPQELMDLLQDWIAGNVPGEILCDGMIDAGMDPEALGIGGGYRSSYRQHFCGECARDSRHRIACFAAIELTKILTEQGAKP